LTARDQLLRLLRIQELAGEIRRHEKVVSEAPGRLEEIEQRFRERNAEYVALKDRFDELQEDRRSRSGELTEFEDRRKKFMEDLMQVKNQREYAAMLKEIDVVKSQISEHEEAILIDMEEIEKLEEELKTRADHIEAERLIVEKDRSEVEAEASSANDVVTARSAERERIESELPGSMRAQVRTLEATRQGIFLAGAENGTCQCCFVRVRPQVFQEIKAASVVHTCGSCRRFLYFEPNLRREPVDAGEPNGVERVDGGVV